MTRVKEEYSANIKRSGFIQTLEKIKENLKSEIPHGIILGCGIRNNGNQNNGACREAYHFINRLTGKKIFFFFNEEATLLEVITGNLEDDWISCRIHDAETHEIAKPILTEFSEKFGVDVIIEKNFIE